MSVLFHRRIITSTFILNMIRSIGATLKLLFDTANVFLLLSVLKSSPLLAESLQTLIEVGQAKTSEAGQTKTSPLTQRQTYQCLPYGQSPLYVGRQYTAYAGDYKFDVTIGSGGTFVQKWASDGSIVATIGTFSSFDSRGWASYTAGTFCGAIDADRSGKVTFQEDCSLAQSDTVSATEPSTCYYEITVWVCYCPTTTPTKKPTSPPSQDPTTNPTNAPTTGPSSSPSGIQAKFVVSNSCDGPLIKTVKLQQTTSDYLNIYELEILDPTGTNIAIGKAASQSSTYHCDGASCVAINAIDGNMTTLSHTNSWYDGDDSNPWLNIDLGTSSKVQKIVIYNRWCDDVDDNYQCLCRLSNANVLLYDGSGSVKSSFSVGDTCGELTLEYDLCTAPSSSPIFSPSSMPSAGPTLQPSDIPSQLHSELPSKEPSVQPTSIPSIRLTDNPSGAPSTQQLQTFQAKFVKISKSFGEFNILEVQVYDSGGTNRALSSLGSIATQSTNYTWGSDLCYASFAIDGNTGQTSDTCNGMAATIEDQNDTWWQVDLRDMFTISSVVVYSREDCCTDRLSHATVSLLDQSGATVGIIADIGDKNGVQSFTLSSNDFTAITNSPTIGPSSPPSFSNSCDGPLIKTVKLQQTSGDYLNIYELEILDPTGTNIAIGKAARQSSTYIDAPDIIGGSAIDAIDGNMTTLSHTNSWYDGDDSNPWLNIDLGTSSKVQKIVIHNRWCGDVNDSHQCLCRLSNANVLLYDGSGSVKSSFSVGDTCGELTLEYDLCTSPTLSPTVATCLPNASKVKIIASPRNYLQLFSVQVFSTSSGSCLTVGKAASQSTTLEDGTPASEALNSIDEYSFSHTRKDDANAWWDVDLGSIQPISAIYIGQHKCRYAPDPTFCFCHLGGANFTLLDDSGVVVASYTLGLVCAKRHLIEFDSSYQCETSPESAAPSSISPSSIPIYQPVASPWATTSPTASPTASPETL